MNSATTTDAVCTHAQGYADEPVKILHALCRLSLDTTIISLNWEVAPSVIVKCAVGGL